jgi:hypothetical protein
MRSPKIYLWEEIKEDFTHKLVLGNGASIAVWDGFKYDSLYDKASDSGVFSPRLKKLFQEFKTRDFELVLKQLRQTSIVNQLVGVRETRTQELYDLLRDALVKTVSSAHPEQRDIQSYLLGIASFMGQFDTVISLNYDLIVYWAMLRGNTLFGQQFKDGFVDDGRFKYDYETLYPPYGRAKKTTMVFYPHGNLILATIVDLEGFGTEIKLRRPEEQAMLRQSIIEAWEKGNVVPLFVSEGDSNTKLKAIKRSSYLQVAYSELESKCETLVLYGLSLGDEDEHILRALMKCQPMKMAISIHVAAGDIEAKCEEVQHKIQRACIKLSKELNKSISPKVIFFNSQSPGCWSNKTIMAP